MLKESAKQGLPHPETPYTPVLEGPFDTSHFPDLNGPNSTADDVKELASEWQGEVSWDSFATDWDWSKESLIIPESSAVDLSARVTGTP